MRSFSKLQRPMSVYPIHWFTIISPPRFPLPFHWVHKWVHHASPLWPKNNSIAPEIFIIIMIYHNYIYIFPIYKIYQLRVSINGGTPSPHPFLDRIFPEINHPAVGVPPWLWKPPKSIVISLSSPSFIIKPPYIPVLGEPPLFIPHLWNPTGDHPWLWKPSGGKTKKKVRSPSAAWRATWVCSLTRSAS